MDALKRYLVAPHPAGNLIILVAAIAALIFGSIFGLLLLPLLFVALVAVIFRDPKRVSPTRAGLVLSPADGTIERIEQTEAPEQLGMEGTCTRISIFLNLLDVHVNRVPVSGTVRKVHYEKGLHMSPLWDKAHLRNERQLCCIETPEGKAIGVVQITGQIARTIVCELVEGQQVTAGQKYGIIRLGCLVDIYLPEGVAPLVIEGQKMVGGESVIADLQASEPAREGLKH